MGIGLVGCGGGGGTTSSPSVGTHVVEGKISDYTTTQGIEGVTVSSNGQSVLTTADGSYELTGLPDGKVVLNFNANGYATTSEIANISVDEGSRASLDINMLPVAFTGTFNPNQDFTAQVPSSSGSVVISAGSLKLANGSTPSGDITAEVTPINPVLDINLMPGDMVVSSGDPIASYGAMTVEFKDASGEELNLASGETSTIRIPVTNRGGMTPPSTIPLYYFDKEEGVWREEGTATLSVDGTYYEGSVSHFSTWNADFLYDSTAIKGCVEDINGTRLSNVKVDMIGQNYNGASNALTDNNGEFIISAMENASSLLTAYTSTQVSNTLSVATGTTDITLNDCLVLSNTPLTVRLTWGENPTDLDTHVIGPNNYHIWYMNLGNYSEELAKLDVDDVTSYGPEVFTAMGFPEAGTYHYSVYHYSGSSTITDSPARVELTLNGRTTAFIPPAGQSSIDTWWNVFDIVVDTNGNITIVPVNTWASNATGPTEYHKMDMPMKK